MEAEQSALLSLSMRWVGRCLTFYVPKANVNAANGTHHLEHTDLLNLDVPMPIIKLFCKCIDRNKDGEIQYEEFTHAIRYGQMDYVVGTYEGKRIGDPTQPLGDSVLEAELPYGIMTDAPKNLEKFDKEMNRRFGKIKVGPSD